MTHLDVYKRQANVPRKLTKDELIQAVRLNIAGELEAIYVYDAHIQATDDIVAKKIIGDIRDEEKAHVGELLTLLKYLDPKEAEFLNEGEEEVREMLEELNIDVYKRQVTAKAEQIPITCTNTGLSVNIPLIKIFFTSFLVIYSTSRKNSLMFSFTIFTTAADVWVAPAMASTLLSGWGDEMMKLSVLPDISIPLYWSLYEFSDILPPRPGVSDWVTNSIPMISV